MRPTLLLASLLLAPLLASAQDEPAPAKDPDKIIADLLAKMSIEEKVGQMTQLTLEAVTSTAALPENPGAHTIDPELLKEAIVDRHVGSIQNCFRTAFTAEHWQSLITKIQDLATKETEHKIPVLYGIDSTHGANYVQEATLFPQPLGLAASWDPDLVEQCFALTAAQTRATGIPWSFSPTLDVGRQPLWSRFTETYGEDVHLTTVLGEASVRGLQGDDISSPDRVAATGKHFLAYSMPLNGRDRTQVIIPDRYLREYFLPPFWNAVEKTQIKSLMVNAGEINGLPVHSNYSILTRLLRDQMGFEGVLISDWAGIAQLHTEHRVAPNMKEAVRMAVDAGIDMAIVPLDYQFTDHLVEMVKDGIILEERLDASVTRILRLKLELGLFENPYPDEKALAIFGTEEAAALSLRAAQESLVLLKNDGVLPLPAERTILLTGPGCTSLPALHGSRSYTWQGANHTAYPKELPNLLTAFQELHGKDNILYAPGTSYDRILDLDRAVRAAQRADVIVCVLAEKPSTGTPGDISDLTLPAAQSELVHALSFGKPLIVILLESRPRLITEIDSLANAVVFASHPGPFGGAALHDLLTGAINPSGKLPFTYPRHPHSILPYDHKASDAPADSDAFNPLYEFGHGLSYTTFAYSKLVVTKPVVEEDPDLPPEIPPLPGEDSEPGEDGEDEEEDNTFFYEYDTLEFSVELTNTGSREGTEVVQVFIRDLYASITPPVKRLRAFKRVSLAPGETRSVHFSIPVMNLSYIGAQNTWFHEAGDFEVTIGNQTAPFTTR